MTTIGQRIARVTQPSTAKIASAAGLNVLGLALSDNWGAAVDAIDEKIATARARLSDLTSQRRSLLLGDDEAELSRVEGEIAALERDVARLRDARYLAAERAAAQADIEKRETYARKLAAWEAGNAEMLAEAEEVDRMARELGKRQRALGAKAEAQARECPVFLDGGPLERPLGEGRTAAAIRMVMAIAGAQWAWTGSLPWRPEDQTSVVATLKAGLDWARHEVGRKSNNSSPITE